MTKSKIILPLLLLMLLMAAGQTAQLHNMRGEVTNIAADTRAVQSETAALRNEIQRRQSQDKSQSIVPLQMVYEHKELLEPCGLTVEELQAGLHYELKHYSADFLQAESDTGVNAVFLASVAALESG